MKTLTPSKKFVGGNRLLPSSSTPFNPDEIRRVVQLGKDRGLILDCNKAQPVAKNGLDAAAEGKLRSQWMDVDPVTAKRWLENNFKNRPIKEDMVLSYARDMKNGTWVPTHQGVAFNDLDELIDGQHRLRAVILSNCTVRMMVTFGLPSKIEGKQMTTMDAVDRGRTRSVADQLTIQHGFKNGSVTASVCASLAGICSMERTRRLSVGETLDIFRTFEAPALWVIDRRSKEHGLRVAGVLAGFAFAMATEPAFNDPARQDHDLMPITAMFEALTTGDGLKAKSPIAHLRDFLTSDEAKLLTRGTNRGVAELTLEAIRLQLKGKPITKLEMSTEGADHFRKLQPDRVAKIAAFFQIKAT